MAKKKIRRHVNRKLTAAERDRHDRIRQQITAQMPAFKARGRAAIAKQNRLNDAVRSLKANREQLGLSLSDVSQRCGIDRGRLSRLENDPHANPTIETLNRIADALGVELQIEIIDAA